MHHLSKVMATMTSFASHDRVAIQAGAQTIHGDVNY
jgi:hypothetical protein